MIIKIYDPETLNAISVLSRFSSMQWVSKFYDVGKFEFHMPMSAKLDPEGVKINNIISFGDKSGIIKGITFTDTETVVRGYCLKGILKQRITVPPFVYKSDVTVADGYDRIKGNAETVIKHYVINHLTAPTDAARKYPNMICAADSGTGASVAWQSRFENLAEVIKDIGIYSKLGAEIKLDAKNRQLVFDVVKSIDRSASQSERAPVVFCKRYKSLFDFEYTKNHLESVNAVYSGAGEEDETQYIYKKLQSGVTPVSRSEGYTSVSGDDTEEAVSGGEAFLKSNRPMETCEASAAKYIYGKDWELGDIVTVKADILGETVTMNKRITEVRETYEKCNTKTEPVFEEV